jgi:hypothetical protein
MEKILNLFHSPLDGLGICSHDYPSAAHSEGTAQTWQKSEACSDCLSECSELT